MTCSAESHTEELQRAAQKESADHEKTKAQLKTALEALRFSQEVQTSCERTMGELRLHVSKLAEGKMLHECDGHPEADDVIEGLEADKVELQARVAGLEAANRQIVAESAAHMRRAGDFEQQLAAAQVDIAAMNASFSRINVAYEEGVHCWRASDLGRATELPPTRTELVAWLLAKLSAVTTAHDEIAHNVGRTRLADQMERTIAEACEFLRPVSGVLGSDMDALIASARSVADLQKKWQKTEAKLQSIRDRQRSIIDHRGQVEIVDIDGKTCGHGHWDEVDGRFVLRVAQRYVAHPPDGKRPTDQPTPTHDPTKPDVWAAVIAHASMVGMNRKLLDVMRARRQLGVDRYGTPLQPFNGRDCQRDLREELLDATAYAGQRAMELRGGGDPVQALVGDVQFKEILAITHAVVMAP